MKGKTVYLIAAIAVILGLIVLLVEKPFQERTSESSTPESLQSIKYIPVFSGVTEDDCFRIEIYQMDGASSATLTQKGGTWYTNPERKYIASKDNVKRIFDALKDIEEGEVRSRNPENHARFQVDKISGTRVKFFGKAGKLLEDVYVGKMGTSYMTPSTFVRKEGMDEVLSVNGYLMSLFRAGEENWRERTIHNFEPEDIVGFKLERPGKSPIELARLASGGWTCLAPETMPASKDVGSRMANAFGRLRDSSFVEDYPLKPLNEYGLGTDAFSITATLRDHSTTPTLYIGNENPEKRSQWYVRAEGDDMVYLIYKYARDNMVKTLDEIKPTPTPTPTPKSDQEEKEKLVDRIQDEAIRKRAEVEKMTDEEKNAAIQEKLDALMNQARAREKDQITTGKLEKEMK